MTGPDPADLPADNLPAGPLTWLTGPEHLAHADALLSGAWRRPHKWSDRIAAAGVHVQAAHVQVMAAVLLDGHIDDGQMWALRAQWMRVLQVPPDVDGIDEVASEWAHAQDYGARRSGPGDDELGG